MKRLALIPVIVSLTGCATFIPLSYDEECASKGMKVSGIDSSTSTAIGYNWQTKQMASVNGYGETVRCETTKTEDEAAHVRNLQPILARKYEYNKGVPTARLLTGIGYFLYVVPGVALSVAYSSAKSKAEADVQAMYNGTYQVPLSTAGSDTKPVTQTSFMNKE